MGYRLSVSPSDTGKLETEPGTGSQTVSEASGLMTVRRFDGSALRVTRLTAGDGDVEFTDGPCLGGLESLY